jgi:hypothetical protein
MVQQLEQFDFDRKKTSKYDWDQLLDGSIWRLEYGVDFACTPQSFLQLVLKTAKMRGGKAQVRIVDEEFVVLRFRSTTRTPASTVAKEYANGNGHKELAELVPYKGR